MGRKARSKQGRAAEAPQARTANLDAPIIAALVILVAIIYSQLSSHSFLNYDDPQFVTVNPQVLQGLKPPTVSWALTSASLGWYPLTWMSHMLDVQLWGPKAGAHLLMNALLHAITAALLFLALRRLTEKDGGTSAVWASAFVAAMFAVHPMHVESVAWISERKDTLSTLFAVLAILFYAADPARVGRVAAAMALSLLAKQMYVTLPFVLLLLDFWPLGRITSAAELWKRARDKWPLFLLTIAGSVVAFIGQHNLEALRTSSAAPLDLRIANAAVAYVVYLGKLAVPVKLAVLYPLLPVPAPRAIAAALLLLAITAIVVVRRKREPWLLTGWFWFVGTLVPVIGLVAIGAQSMADRYTYFSSIGVFAAIAFTAAAFVESPDRKHLRRPLTAAAIIAIAIYTAVAYRQTGYWKNSETLFSHSISVTGPSPMAEYSLGQALELTRPAEAIPHLSRAIAILENDRLTRGIEPPNWYAQAYVGVATARLALARFESPGPARDERIATAITELHRALGIDRNAPHAVNNLAFALALQGNGGKGSPPATTASPVN